MESRGEHSAPLLFLFFKKNKFHEVAVSADNCIIHLQATNIVMAVVMYIALFYAFHVGYAQQHFL